MRDPKRIDTILAVVRETWLRYPDQRFMQLVYNIYRTANLDAGISSDYFYTEDEDLLEYINGLPVSTGEGEVEEGGAPGRDSKPAPATLPPSRKKSSRKARGK